MTVEARAVCGAEAARCTCTKDAGHVEAGDVVHQCGMPRSDDSPCPGAWTGSHSDPAQPFKIVHLPWPAGWDNDLPPLLPIPTEETS